MAHSGHEPQPRRVSEEKPFDEVEYGKNPFTGRAQAKEETARDLDKDPRQLLTDVQEESLTPRPDFVARTVARMASMQLRVQRGAEAQAAEAHKLNNQIRKLTWVMLAFTLLAVIFGGCQCYYARKAFLKDASSTSTQGQPLPRPK